MNAADRRIADLLADPDQRVRRWDRSTFAEAVREGMADQLCDRDWAALIRARASEDLAELGRMLAGYIDREAQRIVAGESPSPEEHEASERDRLGDAEDFAYDCARDRALLASAER